MTLVQQSADLSRVGSTESDPRLFRAPFGAGEVVGGKYEIHRVIGVGCMGYVVAARRRDLGDEVAIKLLRPEFVASPELVARFAQEARVVVRLHSEHVARVFDVGSLTDGTPFMVMEYLEGRDLSQVLAEHGPLPTVVAIEYTLQVCEALAVAHAQGIVHRDVKPANLFLSRIRGTDSIKVLDFGVSKVALTGSVEPFVPLVRTVSAVGSPVYMSPEQIRAPSNVDARADIWSLGCVLHELLAGTAAFEAPSLMQICAMILEDPPPSLRLLNPSVPPALASLVLRCLEKEPGRRFQSVADLACALCPFASELAQLSAVRCRCVLEFAGGPSDESHLSVAPPSSRGSRGGLVISFEDDDVEWLESKDIEASSKWGWKSKIAALLGIFAGALWFSMHPPRMGKIPRTSVGQTEIHPVTPTSVGTPAQSTPPDALTFSRQAEVVPPPSPIEESVMKEPPDGGSPPDRPAPTHAPSTRRRPNRTPPHAEGDPDVGF